MEQLSTNETTQNNRRNLKWLQDQSVNLRLELLNNYLSMCQIMINELLEEEVEEKTGLRYSRNKPYDGRYKRWGYNLGSVRIGDQKVKIDVPRIMDESVGKTQPLDRYGQLRDHDAPTEQIIQGVLRGLSTRDYGKVIDHLGEGLGLSKSEVSRRFVDATSQRLETFHNRDLSMHDFVGLFLDGKYIEKQQVIIALGVTVHGEKIPLDFIHAPTEHHRPVCEMLAHLKERGMHWESGLLVIVDGSKGFRKTIIDSFGDRVIIQRCCWYKRENILSYLPKQVRPEVKGLFDQALAQDTYKKAKKKLMALMMKLEHLNRSVARSLTEEMEEILTLHRLKMNKKFSRAFHRTNSIENLNSQLMKYTRNVKKWKNSMHRNRWVASALLEIKKSMKKIPNYKELNLLQKAIKKEISLKTSLRISTVNGT